MTSWFGPVGRTGRTLLKGFAVLLFVAPLAACDQATEAPANTVSVQLDQAGPYVLVVGGDDKVETRRITLAAPDGAQVVVRRGLETGDKGDRRRHPESPAWRGGHGERGGAARRAAGR